MAGYLWRALLAVIALVIVWAIAPPFLRLVGLELTGDAWTVIRICIGGLAVLYVLKGRAQPPAI